MKKLLTVFAVFFLFCLSSAQSSSVSYEQGYREGFASVLGAVPINMTSSTVWQEVDYSVVRFSHGNAERAKIERLLDPEFNKGFIQGVFYGKQVENQVERAKESKNGKKSKKS